MLETFPGLVLTARGSRGLYNPVYWVLSVDLLRLLWASLGLSTEAGLTCLLSSPLCHGVTSTLSLGSSVVGVEEHRCLCPEAFIPPTLLVLMRFFEYCWTHSEQDISVCKTTLAHSWEVCSRLAPQCVSYACLCISCSLKSCVCVCVCRGQRVVLSHWGNARRIVQGRRLLTD